MNICHQKCYQNRPEWKSFAKFLQLSLQFPYSLLVHLFLFLPFIFPFLTLFDHPSHSYVYILQTSPIFQSILWVVLAQFGWVFHRINGWIFTNIIRFCLCINGLKCFFLQGIGDYFLKGLWFKGADGFHFMSFVNYFVIEFGQIVLVWATGLPFQLDVSGVYLLIGIWNLAQFFQRFGAVILL